NKKAHLLASSFFKGYLGFLINFSGIESPTVLIGGVGAGGGTGLDALIPILFMLQFTFITSFFNNYWGSINFWRNRFIKSNLFHIT
ncbi:hypothetical protein, partial [Acinetobacter baumannii]|uniref:hypothetical protein n=1 Tax=Acinetobacter baumannii TaxID=470 RepID=UPI001C06F9E9